MTNLNSTVFIKSINKLHNEINSITIFFHPKGLIGYCDLFSILWQKVNINWVEMIAGIK